jgi:hypothetical protein
MDHFTECLQHHQIMVQKKESNSTAMRKNVEIEVRGLKCEKNVFFLLNHEMMQFFRVTENIGETPQYFGKEVTRTNRLGDFKSNERTDFDGLFRLTPCKDP